MILNPTDLILIQISAGSNEEAEKIANLLLQEKLAACIQLLPVTSCFNWDNKQQMENEYLLQVKTSAVLFKKIEAAVTAIHSYEVPEILGLPVMFCNKPYENWLKKEVELT